MEDKQDNRVYWLLGILLLVYLVKKELTASQQASAEQKILSDENYNLASQLHSAFHINLISDYINTVDENTVFAIADKIKDFEGVQKAYKDLFSETLISRIQQVFKDDPNKANLFYSKVKTASTQNGKVIGSALPQAGVLGLGKIAIAVNTLNALDYTNSTKVLKQYQAGEEIGKYLGDFPKLIKNVKYAVVEISWYQFWTKKALIVKNQLITY